jgi:hypothetical protein
MFFFSIYHQDDQIGDIESGYFTMIDTTQAKLDQQIY